MSNFAEARRLVTERELDSENIPKAYKILNEIIAKSQTSDVYGLLSEMKYLEGEWMNSSDKVKTFSEGVEYAKKGIELDPNHLESHFWLSVNYGLLGEAQGMMNSFLLLDPIEKHVKKAMEINEGYFYGAPLRVIGYFYHKIPGWPISRGDNKKAKAYLLKALEYGPDFYLNHLYISKVYKSLGDKKNARFHLEWILGAELTRKFQKENSRIKKEAQELLSKI
jgi:tetratricopeptide (TPR) repeat protein